MTFFKFLNTCLIPIFGNRGEDQWFMEYGLIDEVTFIIIAIFSGEILRVLLYPPFLAKWIFRTFEARKGIKSEITQREANWLFENDEAYLGKNMSVMLVFSFTVLFYSPIAPGITIIGIVSTFVLFWVSKVIILRRSVVKKQIDGALLIEAIMILKLCALVHAATNIIFLGAVFDSVKAPSVVGLCVAALF